MTRRLRSRIRVAALAVAALGLLPGCRSDGPEAPAVPVVEVRAFGVEGQAEGSDYVGRAFADSLGRHLSLASGIRVAEDAGGLTHRLEGTVRRRARAAAATVVLTDLASGERVWSTEVDSDHGDLSGMAWAAARETVEALDRELPHLHEYIGDVTGGPAMSASPRTGRVRELWRQNDIEGMVAAAAELAETFPEDPAALVLSAWALMLEWDADPTTDEPLVRLRERLEALDTVDPSSPYQELLRAFVYRSSGEPNKARVLYARVLDRDDLTNTARAWALRQRSFVHAQVGNSAAAVADAERAVQVDPLRALNLAALSRALEAEGRLDEAVARSNEALALEPGQWRHHQRLGLVHSRAKNFDAAVISMERACAMGSSQEACANSAVTLHRAGRPADAGAAAEHAASLPSTRWGRYNLGCYHALAGNAGAAMDDLRRALELGFADDLIRTDGDLDSLRGTTDFEAVLAEVGARIASRQEISSSVFPWQ